MKEVWEIYIKVKKVGYRRGTKEQHCQYCNVTLVLITTTFGTTLLDYKRKGDNRLTKQELETNICV